MAMDFPLNRFVQLWKKTSFKTVAYLCDNHLVLDRNYSNQTIVHHLDENLGLTSKGRVLSIHTPGYITKLTMPFAAPRDLSFGLRSFERLLRSDKCLATPHDGDVIVIRAGLVYRYRESMQIIGEIQGDCPLHRSTAIGASGDLYFGEYFMNPKRISVRVLRVRRNSPLEVAYVFPPGSIRHVHGIYSDPYVPTRLWITVGDEQGECYLYWTDDEFRTMHRIGDGSQWWRAVGLVFTPEKIVWGTDSPHMQNHFVSLGRQEMKLVVGQPVDGTIWYAGTTRDGLHFAGSSVEKGAGVLSNMARVWISKDAEKWEPIKSFEKDSYPMPHFKWGTISFPSGDFSSQKLWMSGEALCGLDGVSRLVLP